VKDVVHDPEAKSDLVQAALFYETRVKGLGARFLKAADMTILKIASNPQMYNFCEKPIRSCRVNGFPYRVLFTDESTFVLILAISHLARQVGWWRYRLGR
jgi:ParE toxin of type II toxin-antitoxin system, parDE